MIAFVAFQSPIDPPVLTPLTTELLLAMSQSAANALDSFLMYEDLRQSQVLMRRTDRLRSLEIIAGGFAHEIRNPLTSIKTFIQLAPERKDDSQFIGEFSRIVLDDVNRIERLIQEILDYARYMEPKLTDEDLNEIVSSCIYFVQIQADRRGIKIEKELASELPRGMVDRQQIKQVILNLLLNAMDAIGENHGAIRVRTHGLQKSDGHEWAHIEIHDTGPGISAEHLDHIFDPFFTTKHASAFNEGTGLGLTIVHQIIQEHRGTIRVQSTEGLGTTFHVQLPCHRS
jgi:signal transduction histidine kinase